MARTFDRCEFAQLLGLHITETWDGGARAVMEIDGKRNPNGVAHGGAVFALADHAFGIAANREGLVEVALSAHIHYIAPAAGKMEAVAERVSTNGRTSVYRVIVREGPRVIAEFEGTGIRI